MHRNMADFLPATYDFLLHTLTAIMDSKRSISLNKRDSG